MRHRIRDKASSADLIIRGRVLLDLAAGFTEALAISCGRMVVAGADDVAGLVGPKTQPIELGGRVAIPGMN